MLGRVRESLVISRLIWEASKKRSDLDMDSKVDSSRSTARASIVIGIFFCRLDWLV